jgi:hypothetical protein
METQTKNRIAERPVLFQTDMVKAIIEGRKTQTRRQIKGQPTGDESLDLKEVYNHNPEYFYKICKYGKPGDLLWVRETWQESTFLPKDDPDYGYIYRASGNGMAWEQGDDTWRWKPSIHMPKSASRIWLMIEDIRVERAQEISEEDAIAEGIKNLELYGQLHWLRYDEGFCTKYPTISFQSLWISINGEESWNANPWVWVIQFRVLSTTGKPSEEQIEKNLSALASLREKREEVSNVE